ncbi:MAG: flagellar protein [Phycisphaerales bacterium]|nr:MAG: flagellar protein [Phycisphaerales bacterium]
MIPVTRLNGKPIVLNADLIRSVEQNPDTTIKLINGETVLVQEEMHEIIEKCIEYGRHLRQMMPRT